MQNSSEKWRGEKEAELAEEAAADIETEEAAGT
jgi:hypothetical protein